MARQIASGLFFEPLAEQNRSKLNVYYVPVPPDQARGINDLDATGIAWGFDNGIAIDSTFRFPFQSISGFRHEGGHGMFGVKDEYSCTNDSGTVRSQTNPFPNIFSDLPTCTALSSAPATCRLLAGAPSACTPVGTWSKSDPDEDIMGGGAHTDNALFGGDCRVRINWTFSQFP